jgi:peptidoglycan-N-acetylglucosamine deacetylase
LDWSQKSAENIAKNVTSNVRPGDIILMHCNEDKLETAKALPIIIENLKKKGYQFVTLDEMLDIPAYK